MGPYDLLAGLKASTTSRRSALRSEGQLHVL